MKDVFCVTSYIILINTLIVQHYLSLIFMLRFTLSLFQIKILSPERVIHVMRTTIHRKLCRFYLIILDHKIWLVHFEIIRLVWHVCKTQYDRFGHHAK